MNTKWTPSRNQRNKWTPTRLKLERLFSDHHNTRLKCDIEKKILFWRWSILVNFSLGISVHCLAVFYLCHLHRFPSGHRQHFSLLMQIEIIKLQIGTHAQLNFSTFEADASPTSVPCVDDGWLLHNSGQAHNFSFLLPKHIVLTR